MYEVERHHDEIVVKYDGYFDVLRENDEDMLVISLKQARELCEKLLEASLPGSFEFILTTPSREDEDG